jgi:type VI secretion system secreted protein Hcp
MATAAFVLTSTLVASAALDASVKVTGARQGAFKHQNQVQVAHGGDYTLLAFQHSIVSPRDASSGLPSGKRLADVIVATIDVDSNSRKPWDNALAATEVESSVEFEFFKPSTPGTSPTKYYDVTLTNATITRIDLVPGDPHDTSLVQGHQRLRVAFTFQKIEVTWTNGGVTASDDWSHAAL